MKNFKETSTLMLCNSYICQQTQVGCYLPFPSLSLSSLDATFHSSLLVFPLSLWQVALYMCWRRNQFKKTWHQIAVFFNFIRYTPWPKAMFWNVWRYGGGGQRLFKRKQTTTLLSSSSQYLLQMCSAAFSPAHREFIDWRYPMSCVHSVMVVFSSQYRDLYSLLLPLSPSHWFTNHHYLSHLSCVTKYTYVCTCSVWGGPQSDTELRQSPFPGHCSDDDILHCFLWALSFYGERRGYSPTAVGSDACTQESQIGNKKTRTKTVSTFTINLL